MAPLAPLNVEESLAKLSKDDKVALLSGANMWHTHKVESLGIPPLRVSDGPNGIRGIRFFNGAPSNCFPCATGLAASWDQDLLEEVGRQFGQECRAKGAHLWLGPTLNMQRSPLGGRGFESFSEDPLLSGRMSASIIRGVQSEGVSAFPKHFVCNDQETDRHSNSTEISMRALREIYLKPFQICIKEGDPWGLMTSYNRVNGIHVPEHPVIMNEILRDEWKFDGTVMSDWYGTYSTIEGINATVDLEMPGPSIWRQKALLRALNSGKIEETVLDGCVRRMLTSIKRAIDSGIEFDKEEDGIDTPKTRALLLKTALESVVLIKNEGNLLPLSSKRIKKLAVLGPNAKEACISGGGSASLKPYYAISPLAGILEQAKEQGIEVTYSAGVHTGKFLPLIQERVESPKTGAGRMDLAYFAQDPKDASVKPVHEKSVDSSYAFMLDNIPFDVVPRQCWMRLTTTFIPDETGEWDFGLTVAGQAELFIDDDVVVSNKENQRPADTFFSNGSQEEIGRRRLESGKRYNLRMEWSNFKKVNPKVAFATFGGFRIGARKFTPADDLVEEALRIARDSDAVIVVTGLNADYESEGFDREDMKQPEGVDGLINKVIEVSKAVCVVAQSGTQTEMPWADNVQALAQAFYGGNETGRAIAHVLFGKHNPSGKLPLSFPKKLLDFPSHPFVPGRNGFSYYTDDVFMGYRGMLLRETKPLAPFGYGLSYTTFDIKGAAVKTLCNDSNEQVIEVEISVTVTNTGSLSGQEVVQVYMSPPTNGPLPRPSKELAGFSKVRLQPGETQTVNVTLDRNMFSYWDENRLFGTKRGAWSVDAGRYTVHVGTSLENIAHSTQIDIQSGFLWRGL